MPLADKDLQLLVKELEKDSYDKTVKLIAILFEIIYQYKERTELEETFTFLKDAIKYSMKHGHIDVVLDVLKTAREISEDPSFTQDAKSYMKMLLSYIGTEEILSCSQSSSTPA